MRRVQDVQVAVEIRILSVNGATFLKLQGLLPQLRKNNHAVLSDAEVFALVRKAQDDAATKLVRGPKITFFPGQDTHFSMDPNKDLPGMKKIDVTINALVAANLQQISLDVKAIVGKAEFNKGVRLDDCATLAQFNRQGDTYLVLLVTPRVILILEEDTAPSAAQWRIQPSGTGRGRQSVQNEGQEVIGNGHARYGPILSRLRR